MKVTEKTPRLSENLTRNGTISIEGNWTAKGGLVGNGRITRRRTRSSVSPSEFIRCLTTDLENYGRVSKTTPTLTISGRGYEIF